DRHRRCERGVSSHLHPERVRPEHEAGQLYDELRRSTGLADAHLPRDDDAVTENELLGEFTFSGIRIAPAGQVRVQVEFALSQDGILGMSARDPDSGAEMKTSVRLGQRKYT
ncbi:MAG: Hsp70 family protein, partial [Myxococcales bacterium]|nr:Hsp70 family protein [Myxococcales bacterium]